MRVNGIVNSTAAVSISLEIPAWKKQVQEGARFLAR